MRHEVPQFIDIEDKIFGPLTFKQAIYLAGSIGAAFIIYYGLGKLPVNIYIGIKLALAAPFVALGLSLAFINVNKRPFIYFMESAFYYFIKSKKYIWKKKEKNNQHRHRLTKEHSTLINSEKSSIPVVSRSKLKDLAWSLDMDTNNHNN